MKWIGVDVSDKFKPEFYEFIQRFVFKAHTALDAGLLVSFHTIVISARFGGHGGFGTGGLALPL